MRDERQAERLGRVQIPGQETAADVREATRARVARILVADDSDTSRAVTVHSLKTIGFEVDAVANGEEAVDACATQHYDLVLMDFHMPKLDGFEATKRIRASEQNGDRATIIALTASGTEEDLLHCRDVGMDGHLFKLMSPQELRDSVKSWLNGGTKVSATIPEEWRSDAPPAEEAASPRPAAGSIDWSVIDALREFSTDDDLLQAIVASFHTNINESLPELERAARAGEADTTRFIAHRLRGTCGNVGAMRMQFLFGRIEEIGRAGVTTGTSELIGDLWSEYARVRAALAGGGGGRDGLDRG
jgi:CheY-like chemotaxis protein